MQYLDTLPKHVRDPDPDIFVRGSWICIDLETTNRDHGHARDPENYLVFGYGLDSDGIMYTWNTERAMGRFQWERYDFIIAHNAKFECQWLQRADVATEHILWYDTLLAEYCIAGNRFRKLDLDSMGQKYAGIKKDPKVAMLLGAGVCPSEIPIEWMRARCQLDVMTTVAIFEQQRMRLVKDNLLNVTYTACCFVPVAADIEMTGMCLDPDMVWLHYEKDTEEHRHLTLQLEKFTGGINMGSPQQVAEYLYTKLKFKEITGWNGKPIRNKPNKAFPEGQPLTDSDTMEKLVARTKKQREFIRLKIAESVVRQRINTYLKRFVHAVEECDNMLWGRINQAVTRTHRLSSSGPNLQNIDRGLKRVFTARRPGFKIGQRDYDQLEYRVAGDLARCPVVKKTVEEGIDVHVRSASIITPQILDMEKGSPEWNALRTGAKEHTFKPLYGGTSGTPEEQRYYQWFNEYHEGVCSWHARNIDRALAQKVITVPTGMKFYFPYCKLTKSGYVEEQQKIKNYPVQYLATGEIVLIGTFLLWSCLKVHAMQTQIINEVHDAIITEESEKEHAEVEEMAHQCMTDGVLQYLKQVYDYDYQMPLTFETKLQTNWSHDKQ